MKTKHRIEKIEQQLNSMTTMPPVLLREPDDPTQDAAFTQEIADTLASGAKVIVRTAGPKPRKRYLGVEHFAESDFLACLAITSLTPDPEHGDRLRAVLKAINNNPLPIAQIVTGDDWGDD